MHMLHAKGSFVPLIFCWSMKQQVRKGHHARWEPIYVLWISKVKKDPCQDKERPMFPLIVTSTQRIKDSYWFNLPHDPLLYAHPLQKETTYSCLRNDFILLYTQI